MPVDQRFDDASERVGVEGLEETGKSQWSANQRRPRTLDLPLGRECLRGGMGGIGRRGGHAISRVIVVGFPFSRRSEG